MSTHSITGGGFNARVPEEKPAPMPRTEGQPRPTAPVSPGYTRTNADLKPSEAPVFDLDLSKVSDRVARMLAAHDRSVAESNGVEAWRVDAAQLDADVKAGRISAADAERIFRHVHPTITAEQLRGEQ